MRKKYAYAAVACLLILSLMALASYVNAAPDTSTPAKKSVITFKEKLAVTDARDFVSQNDLQPFAITFSGDDYACGGTIEKIEDIDRVTQAVIEGWGDELADPKIPDDYKEKVKARIKKVEVEGFKVRDIEVTGSVPDKVRQSNQVKEIAEKR